MVLGRFATVAGSVAVLVSAMLGSAGQAAADSDSTYVMPDVTGMSLDDATDEITALDPRFKLDAFNLHGTQDPLVLANWKVCAQRPYAGTEFTPKQWLGVGVTRKGTDC
jgi:PASTA domain